MEFVHLIGNTYCCLIGRAQVGVYFLSERDVVMIDSGTVKSPELMEMLERKQLRVRAILNTHLHVDHIANNEALVEKYCAEVFASDAEMDDLKLRGMEMAFPVARNRYGAPIVVDGVVFETVMTPGHTLGHQMIVTPDGVCNVGDAIMTNKRLQKAKMPYMRDITKSLFSMETIRQTRYPLYLAAHLGEIRPEELDSTLDANIEIELKLYDILRGIVQEPISVPDLAVKFIFASGVKNPEVLKFKFMHDTAKARIFELVHAGEFMMKGDRILPKDLPVED